MLSLTLRIDKSDNYHLIDDYLDNNKQKRNSLNFHHLLPYFNKITMILAIAPFPIILENRGYFQERPISFHISTIIFSLRFLWEFLLPNFYFKFLS